MGKYHDRINWKKELRLLPGYIIVCAWVALTAAILFWIVCASLSSTKEILTGRVMDRARCLCAFSLEVCRR